MAWARRWTCDDGFINYRVVDQLVHGHGPVFNVGERVEVATSPLWIALLTIARVVLRPLNPASGAVVLELLLTGVGVASAIVASTRLRTAIEGTTRLVVPLLAVVFLVVTPFLDFSTSGLEGSLTWCWLGVSFLLVVNGFVGGTIARRTWIVVGLAPLVRPDLALLALPLVVALVVHERRRRHAWISGVGLLLAAPVAYEVFRMAYYGVITPNTALAKEGTSPVVSRGVAYAADFLLTGRALVPIIVAIVYVLLLASTAERNAPSLRMLVLAPAVGAALDGAYVVIIGGDYMRGRLLLPALLAALLPVAAIPVDRTLAALACMPLGLASVHPPRSGWIVLEERAFTIGYTGNAHPITLDDWSSTHAVKVGRDAAATYAAGESAAFLPVDEATTEKVPIPGSTHPRVVVPAAVIGAISFAATPDVQVIDTYGLGDVVGGRFERVDPGLKAGHDKPMPLAWVLAQLPPQLASALPYVDPIDVEAARRALACGDISAARHAADDPLDAAVLFDNLVHALPRSVARWPPDPRLAEERECGSASTG